MFVIGRIWLLSLFTEGPHHICQVKTDALKKKTDALKNVEHT